MDPRSGDAEAAPAQAIVTVAAKIGYLTSVTNPLALVVAQPLLGIPVFSGAGFRLALFALFLPLGIWYLLRRAPAMRTGDVIADKSVRDQLKTWEDMGYRNLPVCIAKTQYSFSTDPNMRGAPTGHSIPVREVRLSAGAGFIVAICGEIMTMPGLPKAPSAEFIRFNESGQIDGLF